MVTQEIFNMVEKEQAHVGSWAVWADIGDRPKSNMDDLSIFSCSNIGELLPKLHTRYILVGLNISAPIEVPLSNFHGKNGEVYKARFALKDTCLWGAYMTDIIKNHVDAIAANVVTSLEQNQDIEKKHICAFVEELQSLGIISVFNQERNRWQIESETTLVAFGNAAFAILSRYFEPEGKLLKIWHYAAHCNQEKYRDHVLGVLRQNDLAKTARI